MHLAIFNRVRAGLLALAVALSVIFAGVAATPGSASAAPLATQCRDFNLSHGASASSIRPYMVARLCYNGISIWQAGGITPGVTLYGWSTPGFSWYGSYNSGGNWIGVGENFSITVGGRVSFTCYPRWMIDRYGSVFSYQKNC